MRSSNRLTVQVYSQRFGSADWLPVCCPTLDAWCGRHGYELRLHGSPGTKYPGHKFAVLDMLAEFLETEADRFLFVDADVYVRDDAPGIPLDALGFHCHSDSWHQARAVPWREWCKKNLGEAATPEFRYFNSGVWACDRETAAAVLEQARPPFIVGECLGEQDQFNYWVWKSGVVVNRLPSVWNRYGGQHEPAWFVHLWGTGNKLKMLEAAKNAGMLDGEPTERLECIRRELDWKPGDRHLVVGISGGLGNQLFEFAAGLALARRSGLPLRWNFHREKKRKFQLGVFGIPDYGVFGESVLPWGREYGTRAYCDKLLERINASAESLEFHSLFQHEDCFREVAGEMRSIFSVRPAELKIPKGCTPVAVQVRRGDYLSHRQLCVTTEGYFRRGMDMIRRLVENPWFFVVSDDPAWCVGHLGGKDVTVMPPQTPIEGFRVMAACRAHVISNSTYGWWGAWLAESGPVVAPSRWFVDPDFIPGWDPIPERWLRAEVGWDLPSSKRVDNSRLHSVGLRRG